MPEPEADNTPFDPEAAGDTSADEKKKKRKPFTSTHTDIKKLIADAINNPGDGRMRMAYASVGEEEAKKLHAISGVDFTGYDHVLDSSSVRHILSRHGTGNERDDANIPLELNDIEIIPQVIASPDEVSWGDKSPRGLDIVKYKKRINGHIIYFEEARHGRKILVAMTMYKTRVDRKESP